MSSTSTRAPYGMSFSGPAQSGGNDGAFIDIFRNGAGDFISDLSQYKSQGVRAILKLAGALPNYTDSNLSFVMSLWTTAILGQYGRAPAAQVRNFVLDGTLLAHNIMDDCEPGSPSFNGKPPTMEDLDVMAQYSKSLWTFLPCYVRVHNTILAAKSNWTYVDGGWMQWRASRGQVGQWYVNNINVGRSLGLGSILGFNFLDGGSGLTAPWNIHVNKPNLFGMSPMEIDACTAAIQSAATYFVGMYGWTADPQFDDTDYYSRADLQSSLQALANTMVGRRMGPINWRDSGSTGTSISTATQSGGWSIRDDGVGTVTRKNNAVNMSVPAPSVYATGDLHCLLCYSRDSGLTATTPSDWSETKRFISGNSAQGGELVLFHKVGSGASETPVTVSYPGGGTVAGTSLLARWFVISHASTNAANLIAVSGSGRSWPSQTSLGPIPGATSIRSDALFLICGARANDFGGGSVDENWLSATSGPESWARMFATGSDLGIDAGFAVDYAPTSGLASVSTKAWSLTSGSQAGAGCGFMVAFAPFSVVSGQPPQLNGGFGDITVSVGSNVSFTLQSTGSTPFTYSKTSGPSNVTLGASTGDFQFTPTSVGTYIIVLSVSNAFGSDSDSLRVFAVSTTPSSNNTPVITHPGNKTVLEHQLLSFQIAASDPDGDPITYSLENSQVGMFLDDTTGQFIWIPSGTQSGTYPLVCVVSDGRAESRSTFTITVTDARWVKEQHGLGVGNSFRRV